MDSKYGLPDDVRFCKKCVMPNTRPTPTNEYKHKNSQKHGYVNFDEEGVCSACRFSEEKWGDVIDWNEREEELLDLLNRYRSKDGSYDCIVPGSGGKDSIYASHLLKYKYNMHPLTVTWAPHLYTDIGFQNFQNWIHKGGFDNFLFTPNGQVHRLLARNAFLNLLHPFQPFVLGQKTFAAKMASKFNIKLIFYGENPGQYGANTSINEKKFGFGKNTTAKGHRLDFLNAGEKYDEIYLGGTSVAEYLEQGLTVQDLEPYFPLPTETIVKKNLDIYYLGYFIRWVPQEAYYYSVENADFKANPARSEGTYSKYSSLDDKTDGFFYYTAYIKFGFGRTTQDASQEVRNNHINRDEAVALVKKYDGEFPNKYFKDFLEYLSIDEELFHDTCDQFRSPQIWKKLNGKWALRHTVS